MHMDRMGPLGVQAGLPEETGEEKEEEEAEDEEEDATMQTPSLHPYGQLVPKALNLPSAAQKPSFSCVEVAQ